MANVTAPSSSSSPPVKVIANYRCKQKQYHGVFWSLKFILALLRHTPLLNTTTAAPSPSTESFRDKVKGFEAAADGAGEAFDAAGPLSASQLLSLRHSFTDDDVRQLCLLSLSGYIHHRSPAAPALVWDTVFAAPTALMQILWPTSHFQDHYTRALAAAHRKRINHSDLLSQPGYLQEAGLHAEHVFTGAAADADTVATAFTDPRDVAAAAEWRRLIRCYTAFLPDRSHIHELENLPQEVAIGELLRDAVAAVQREGTAAAPPAFALDCVVDVGGGNGFLAAQVAERLQCDGVVIDPFFPAHAIDCCPRVWPDTAHRTHAAVPRRQTLHRTMALFRDVRWCDVVPAAPSRTALIAKHLCGSGVDEVLQRLEAQDCLPRVLVLAPCCFHRCSLDTHINPRFVAGVLGLESEECFAQLARLTDWNVSVHQRTQEADGQRRHVSQKSVRHLVSCPEGVAAGVEAVVNQGRVQWLQQRGYTVRLVQYVPDVVTPKNKCIVAYRPEA